MLEYTLSMMVFTSLKSARRSVRSTSLWASGCDRSDVGSG